MTDGNPRPDDTESTENAGRDLAAPFIPGGAGRERQPPEEATPSQAVEPDTDDADAEAPAPEPEPATPTAEAEPAGSLPFEAARDADEGGVAEEAGAFHRQAEDEEDFPFGAFDLEGGEGEAIEQEGAADETAEDREMNRAWELADRLEEAARRLRDRGAAAAREGLESSDRFTALLSSLLAGYLARDE